MSRQINWPELLAALALGAIGVFMVLEGSEFSLGSLKRMGPGYMPVAIGVALIGFSAGLVIESGFAARRPFPFSWRPVLAVSASMLFFAAAARPLGLIPATMGVVVLAAIAAAPFRPLRAALAGLVIAALGYLVFVLGLRISLNPFWW